MAEAQFLPSSIYGLDPVSLTAKVAQTNATIAGTQATRQSMTERAQMMRLRDENAKREQEQYDMQKPFQQEIMQTAHVKRQADVAKAYAEIEHVKYAEQQKAGFHGNATYYQDLITNAKGKDNWQGQIDAMDDILVKHSNLSTFEEGKQYLSYIDVERRNLVAQRDKADAAKARQQLTETVVAGRERIAAGAAQDKSADNTRSDQKAQFDIAKSVYDAQLGELQHYAKSEEDNLKAATTNEAKADFTNKIGLLRKKAAEVHANFAKTWQPKAQGQQSTQSKAAPETPATKAQTIAVGDKEYPLFEDAAGNKAYQIEDGTYIPL